MSVGFSGGSSQVRSILESPQALFSTFTGTGVPMAAVKIGTTIWQVSGHVGYNLVLLELDVTTQSLLNSYECEIFGADTSQGLINGGDGYLYMGGGGSGHVIRFNLTTHLFEDLGHVSGVTFFWDFCFGNDGNIYAGTSPNSKLIRITPGAGTLADMGSADPTQTMSRWLATGTGNYVYIGIGPSDGKIVAYDTVGATFTDITPVGAPEDNTGDVWTGIDGNPYGQMGPQAYSLSGLTATPTGSPSSDDTIDSILISESQIDVYDPNIPTTYNMDLGVYSGGKISLYQIGTGENGTLYGGSVLPAYFFETNGSNTILRLMGNGELFTILGFNNKVYMSAYACGYPLFVYDPSQPAGPSNPRGITYDGAYNTWRPMSACVGSDNNLYYGSRYRPETTEGPLVVLNPYNLTVNTFIVYAGQMPQTVCRYNDVVLFGTTIEGNEYPSPPPQDPVLGAFNPSNETVSILDAFPGYQWLMSMTVFENIAIFIAVKTGTYDADLFFYNIELQEIERVVALPFQYEYTKNNLLNYGDKIFGVGDLGVLFEVDPVNFLVRRVSTITETNSTVSRSNPVIIGDDLYYERGAKIMKVENISEISGWF